MTSHTYNKIHQPSFLQAFFIFFLFAIGSTGLADEKDPLFNKAYLQKVFNEELAVVKQTQHLAVDELWALKNISKLQSDSKLANFVNKRKSRISDDPFLLLIDPKASKIELPKETGTGAQKLFQFMSAPFGKPKKRAISFLKQFVEINANGYILTHQYMVLEWAKQTGVIASNAFESEKSELLEKIYQEQKLDLDFSDLYAERSAILLNYGKVSKQDARKWLITIINSHQTFGGWGEFTTKETFDGQEATIKPSNIHTRVLVLWSMQQYINNYF